jgi:UPF0755 protein
MPDEITNLDWRAAFKRRSVLYGILILAILLFLFYYFFYQTPNSFKPDTTIQIQSGKSLMATARDLERQGIVTSPFWLTNLVVLMGGEHRVVAGNYYFGHADNLFRVARRITHGDFGLVQVKVTIPEGTNIYEMNQILSKKFNLFNSVRFLELAKDKEGYLFPDTYFFLPTVQPTDVIDLMSKTYQQKIAALQDEIATSSHPEKDIITMASILEGEAKTETDRKLVAGILWRRLAIGIALQVDSSFKYVNGKTSGELTTADLKINSPYNTYRFAGLPPTPISNPGLDSIKAALEPTSSDYLYFLSDKEGNIHYAKTLQEQIANKRKYL